MSKVETPVSGGDGRKSANDGVSGTPGGPAGVVSGRKGGSESEGGAYPNPQTGKEPTSGGFMSHGGQTEIGYHGAGQAGTGDAPNAVAGSDSSDGRGLAAVPTATHSTREVSSSDRSFTVVENSGVAEAEAQGKVATDADYEREQNSPGSG